MGNQKKAFSALSLAAKAGKVKSGEFQTEITVKQGMAYLAVVAEDASEGTKKKFCSLCEYFGVPTLFYGTRESLGSCIGKDFRATLAITDERLAEMVSREIKTEVAKADEST